MIVARAELASASAVGSTRRRNRLPGDTGEAQAAGGLPGHRRDHQSRPARARRTDRERVCLVGGEQLADRVRGVAVELAGGVDRVDDLTDGAAGLIDDRQLEVPQSVPHGLDGQPPDHREVVTEDVAGDRRPVGGRHLVGLRPRASLLIGDLDLQLVEVGVELGQIVRRTAVVAAERVAERALATEGADVEGDPGCRREEDGGRLAGRPGLRPDRARRETWSAPAGTSRCRTRRTGVGVVAPDR